jgi:hypothetical protein
VNAFISLFPETYDCLLDELLVTEFFRHFTSSFYIMYE